MSERERERMNVWKILTLEKWIKFAMHMQQQKHRADCTQGKTHLKKNEKKVTMYSLI